MPCSLLACRGQVQVINRTVLGDDYNLLAKELLVTKDPQQLRNRSKNQRNGRAKNNIIKRYYSLYSEFIKWDRSVYLQICDLVITHGLLDSSSSLVVTSWRMLQQTYFYFYNELALRYFWLYTYFQFVKSARAALPEEPEIPFLLTLPHTQCLDVGAEKLV